MPSSKRHPKGFIRPERVLSQCPQSNGYLIVSLSKNNRRRTKQVHKLMADAFLEQGNMECINHKDEDKTNNSLSNLEWVTFPYNSEYSNARTVKIKKSGKEITIKNLSRYCRENNLNEPYLRKVIDGNLQEYRGYTL